MTEQPPRENRLANEKSPYLRQHARNPMDWYPWGEEAFETARRLDKPIFLSIGYSTCHWCHVMEEESFADPLTGQRLSDVFVPIKVDREERPDVDAIYMRLCQMLTGSGGWPLTLLLTPDRRPFFAATYMPRSSRFGRPGVLELCEQVEELWHSRRAELDQSAQQITTALRQGALAQPGPDLDEPLLRRCRTQLGERFDSTHGGFGSAPKFPAAHDLTFLLRAHHRWDDPHALAMVDQTLAAIGRGGIWDHVGFGLHRYSTDEAWQVPHFEKMLYDQALFAIACLEAFAATGHADHARLARHTFEYVGRDLAAPEGAFYTAEDADSEGVEGKFYTWTWDQLREELDDHQLAFLRQAFNVRPEGNYEAHAGEPHGNILYRTRTWPQLAEGLGRTHQTLLDAWESTRQKLLAARSRRPRPLRDDKILTSWNGLMIAALARGAVVLGDPALLQAAQKAAAFLLHRLRTPDGRLLHRYHSGTVGITGQLEDYACLTWGLLELYEADFDPDWLTQAIALTDQLRAHFAAEPGGFYASDDDDEQLIVRTLDAADSAMPSANALAAMNLLRLGALTGEPAFESDAARLFRAFSAQASQVPLAFTSLLSAFDFALGPRHEVVIVGGPDQPDTRALLEAARAGYQPNTALLLRPPGSHPITRLASFTDPLGPRDRHALAYVCTDHACRQPTADPVALRRELLRSPA